MEVREEMGHEVEEKHSWPHSDIREGRQNYSGGMGHGCQAGSPHWHSVTAG